MMVDENELKKKIEDARASVEKAKADLYSMIGKLAAYEDMLIEIRKKAE